MAERDSARKNEMTRDSFSGGKKEKQKTRNEISLADENSDDGIIVRLLPERREKGEVMRLRSRDFGPISKFFFQTLSRSPRNFDRRKIRRRDDASGDVGDEYWIRAILKPRGRPITRGGA